jgi:hypothetical protein
LPGIAGDNAITFDASNLQAFYECAGLHLVDIAIRHKRYRRPNQRIRPARCTVPYQRECRSSLLQSTSIVPRLCDALTVAAVKSAS